MKPSGAMTPPEQLSNSRGVTLQLGQRAISYPNAMPGVVPGIWVTNSNWNYLVGLSNTGKGYVTSVQTAVNNCYLPAGIKVDHAGNVWVGCPSTTPNGSSSYGEVAEYSSTGAYLNAYLATVSSFNLLPSDAATDSSGHVFASGQGLVNGSGGIMWWNAGSQTATAIAVPGSYDTSYMDVDNNGNAYVAVFGCPSSCGFGLDKISNTTTSPVVTNLIPIGGIGNPGGVYVSNHGKTLNVTDQNARTITRYALPWTGAKRAVLGPTPTNNLGQGNPVSGGFNKYDTNVVQADSYGWLDFGTVSTNTFKAVQNTNIGSPGSAAYEPSDK